MAARRYLLIAGGVVLLVAGGTFALLAPRSHQPPSLPVAAASVTPSATPSASPTAAALQQAVPPTRVIIPSIGVNAPVEPVGLCPTSNPNEDCDGVQSGGLATPLLSASNLTGWWDGGSAPGQNGPAVIVGHVDNPNPAVFWNLNKMVAGESIEVEPGNLQFTVVATQQVSKGAFPTQAVYGATSGPTLRLITCTGDFVSGHYTDNFIVYAVLAHPSG